MEDKVIPPPPKKNKLNRVLEDHEKAQVRMPAHLDPFLIWLNGSLLHWTEIKRQQ